MKRAILMLCVASLASACVGESPESQTEYSSTSGPLNRPGGPSEVWSVTRSWADIEQEAGVAWEADSGLTWEEKFSAWVQSFETVPGYSYGKSFAIRTPYGEKTLPAPTLDCGEVAYTLRVAFASWYHLPFFVTGWDSQRRQPIYAGHFGFVMRDGIPHPDFPSFRNSYRDHEQSWRPGQAWPRDDSLRRRHLGDDDANPFLEGSDNGAGAYFDEIFLNKRAGQFARLLLLWFGSMHLADGGNMFHVKADAIRAGDTLLKRSQRIGTGHTVPVLHVEHPLEGKVDLEVASGNIPRRQPLWEDTLTARHRFTSNYYGGEGENSEGHAYATLGGGLRRWRSAVLRQGRWQNDVAAESRDAQIPDSDVDAIAARPKHFDEILISGSPEEQIATALQNIEAAREHLRKYPASCSARLTREDAFADLYRAAPERGQAELDDEHRTLEDYVFSEMVYEQSKTCCWNSTTEAMAEIIVDYARIEQQDAEAQGVCVTPTVFRAEDGGYERWRAHAASLGRAAEWVDWSEDEPCPQRDVANDTVETARSITPWCE